MMNWQQLGNSLDLQQLGRTAATMVLQVAGNVAAAIVLWFVGRWVIGLVLRLLSRQLERQSVDRTLVTYLERSAAVLLNVVLIISVLGFFGIQTTTFAALIAAGGVAIGVAWSGLLANLAAGAFLVVLRPFKVGDFITGGGVTGTVEAIGLFGTTINSPDNVLHIVGNNKIMADTIQNYSTNAYRRVDIVVTIAAASDHQRAMQLLRKRIAELPHVLHEPEPQVDVLQLTAGGPQLCVRPFCNNEHYWDVYFATTRAVREAFGEAGIALASPSITVHQAAAV
jgi:small conductance mechanosensitive channel